jgi:hypothetical protein
MTEVSLDILRYISLTEYHLFFTASVAFLSQFSLPLFDYPADLASLQHTE